MTGYRVQIADALDAVAIIGPLRYAWLGRRSRVQRAALLEGLDADRRRKFLLGLLREELYASFYCRGRVVPARWEQPLPSEPDARLAYEIADANAGRGGRQPGWTVKRIDRDEALATLAGIRARVPLAACRPERGPLAPGAAISLPKPARVRGLASGFLTVTGDAGDQFPPPAVRVYWHVTRPGVPALVRALTAELNARAVPFELKVADHPLRLDRCDAAVLYLRGDDFTAMRPFLTALADRLASTLRPLVPAFTLTLAAGVGGAEEHGGEQSFGARRCALLAEGILEAREQGARRANRLETVVARFNRAGVDVDAPYREPALAGRHVL